MPYIRKKTDSNAGAETNSTLLNTGGSVIPGSDATQGQTNRSQKGSGRWVNLQKYLENNMQQAANMGSEIAQGIDSDATAAKASVSDAASMFSNQVSQNTIQKDDQLLNQLKQDPTQVDKSSFVRMRDASYKGPNDLYDMEGFGDATNRLNQADEKVNLSKLESGRSQLLRDRFERANYTQGENKLDQLLLQNSNEARQQFGDLRNRWSGLQSFLSGEADAARSQAKQARLTTDEARQLARQTVAEARQGIQGQNEQEMQDFLAGLDERTQGYQADLSDNTIRSDRAEQLGISDLVGRDLYDLNLQSYLNTVDPTTVSQNQFVDEQEAAKLNALASLMDEQGVYQAADKPGTKFDRAKLIGDLEQREADYQAAYQPVKAALDETIRLGPVMSIDGPDYAGYERRVAELENRLQALDQNFGKNTILNLGDQ